MDALEKYLVLGFLFFSVGGASAWAFGEKRHADSSAASSNETVWITRSDGAQSCGMKAAQTVDSGSEELARAKIQVLSSTKTNDGKMRAAVCGMPTGGLNAYEIPRSQLGQALALGFQEASKALKLEAKGAGK